MKQSLSACPLCEAELVVSRLYCPSCDTTIEGRFTNGAFPGLTHEQLDFVETFVRCEGKITRMEDELNFPIPPYETDCMKSFGLWVMNQVRMMIPREFLENSG